MLSLIERTEKILIKEVALGKLNERALNNQSWRTVNSGINNLFIGLD
jgi:hypothetical protein